MIKLGAVNIDTSHPKAFSDYFNAGERARYVGVCNEGFRGDDEVKSFLRRNPEAVEYDSLSDMAENVDLAFIHSCNWDSNLELARPFIDAKVPVFIDKPMVGNMRECKIIERLAADGAVILGSSCLRYSFLIDEFNAIPVDKRGKILHITSTIGVDEFSYAIHAIELIMGYIPDDKAETVQYVGKASAHGHTIESYLITFASGITAMYHSHLNAWQAGMCTVMTTKTSYTSTTIKGNIYAPMLDAVCDYMEGKPSKLATVPQLTESIKIMLAGRYSKLSGGIAVSPLILPDDFGFDGDAYEKSYAAAAKKIYL